MTLGNLLSLLNESGVLNNAQQSQSPAGDIMNLMGSLLGGGQAAPGSGQPQSAGGDVADLLGSLLGGAQAPAPTAQPAADAGIPQAAGNQAAADGILGMLINVMQTPAGLSVIQPVVNQVAEKIGIPPQTALMVVTFAIQYLATNHGTRVAGGEDLSDILQQHSDSKSAQVVDMSAQLAKQTGLDKKTAAKAMAETFKLLGVNP